jgi:deoxyhypusine synthase
VSDVILKFPNSKRKLTVEEERLVRSCSNQIYNIATDDNPFIKAEQRILCIEEQLKTLIKKIYELDEDKK